MQELSLLMFPMIYTGAGDVGDGDIQAGMTFLYNQSTVRQKSKSLMRPLNVLGGEAKEGIDVR